MKTKNIYIIAGPNGSGKTTFAKKFLPNYAECQNFVNTDLIAQGLSPFSPRAAAIKAGKLVLQQIRDFANKGVNFAFETTLSGRMYANLFKNFKLKGYKLHLYFLWIPNSALAIARIKERVLEGGHDVAVQDVRRRFRRSVNNFFKLYQPLVDIWMLFNNTDATPVLIAQGKNGHISIENQRLFEQIKKMGNKI